MFNGNGEVRTGTLFTGSFCATGTMGFGVGELSYPSASSSYPKRTWARSRFFRVVGDMSPPDTVVLVSAGSDDGIFPTSTEGFDVLAKPSLGGDTEGCDCAGLPI